MVKNQEINGSEEIGLVTPSPALIIMTAKMQDESSIMAYSRFCPAWVILYADFLCNSLASEGCDFDFNSLAPGRPRCHFKTSIFNLVLLIGIFTLSNDNPLR